MIPKQTVYKGKRFKSLLEARWAIFFDCIGVKWKYEPRQYRLGYYPEHLQARDARIRDRSYGQFSDHHWFDSELTYTPDFILPDHELFVEVKPSELTRTEYAKVGRLSYRTQRDFLILIGLDKYLRVYWFDIDYPQEINDLSFLSVEQDGEALGRALRAAKEFGRKKSFAEFEEEDF